MENIDDILYRILEGNAKESDISNFSIWIKESENVSYFNNLKKVWHISHNLSTKESINVELKAKYINKITKAKHKQLLRRNISIATASAAAILIVCLVIWQGVFSNISQKVTTDNIATKLQKPFDEDVLISSSKGYNEKLINAPKINSNIIVSKDGKSITYNIVNADISTSAEDIEYNTISVPRGKKVFIGLSDGTKLWINSDTKVTYPVIFPKDIREIKIDGNIYVEVAKDASRPFIAISGDCKTTALGTSFEINNYDKNHQRIALLEGSISVENSSDKVILQPNSEAVLSANHGSITKRSIDGGRRAQWINSTLYFDNITFLEVLKELERWHNVIITNNTHNLENVTFTGKLDEATILNHLELISKNIKIKFIKEGNTITVWN